MSQGCKMYPKKKEVVGVVGEKAQILRYQQNMQWNFNWFWPLQLQLGMSCHLLSYTKREESMKHGWMVYQKIYWSGHLPRDTSIRGSSINTPWSGYNGWGKMKGWKRRTSCSLTCMKATFTISSLWGWWCAKTLKSWPFHLTLLMSFNHWTAHHLLLSRQHGTPVHISRLQNVQAGLVASILASMEKVHNSCSTSIWIFQYWHVPNKPKHN